MRRYCYLLAIILGSLAPTQARSQVAVVFGTSWDGPTTTLQSIVDSRYGVGVINVTTDFIGGQAGDPDPFFWIGDEFSAFLIREIAGNANTNLVGWYREDGAPPTIDGFDDGIVFAGADGDGRTATVTFSQANYRFGFYFDPNGSGDATNAPQPELFFTNRTFNDVGPNGTLVHPPAGGDVQALIFDVSPWSQPNTWLVCFEDVDSGATPGPIDSADTDNDFNDLVMEVRALGATPVATSSFGSLKHQYR